jgi:hypothetical protein
MFGPRLTAALLFTALPNCGGHHAGRCAVRIVAAAP